MLPVKMEAAVRSVLAEIEDFTWKVAYLTSEFYSQKQIAHILNVPTSAVSAALNQFSRRTKWAGKRLPWADQSYRNEKRIKSPPPPPPKIVVLTWDQWEAHLAKQEDDSSNKDQQQ